MNIFVYDGNGLRVALRAIIPGAPSWSSTGADSPATRSPRATAPAAPPMPKASPAKEVHVIVRHVWNPVEALLVIALIIHMDFQFKRSTDVMALPQLRQSRMELAGIGTGSGIDPRMGVFLSVNAHLELTPLRAFRIDPLQDENLRFTAC